MIAAGARYDLAIVADALEYMEKGHARKLLAALRDVHASRLCVAVRTGERWQGLTSHWDPTETDGGPIHLYKYDIATYKQTPDWLNSRHWANPAMWNKYRW